jgi:hypothetical protein
MVIEALKGSPTGQLDLNFQKVLKYLSDNISSMRLVDPANTNNIISETLTQQEKNSIAQKAKEGCFADKWNGVIW